MYTYTFENAIGDLQTVTYTDSDIDATIVASQLRSLAQDGAFIAPSEIAAAAFRELD